MSKEIEMETVEVVETEKKGVLKTAWGFVKTNAKPIAAGAAGLALGAAAVIGISMLGGKGSGVEVAGDLVEAVTDIPDVVGDAEV